MGTMRVMSPVDGDKVLSWDPDDPKSVEKAQKKFEKHIADGNKAYKVTNKPQRSGQPVKTFNADAEEYLLAPAMAGG